MSTLVEPQKPERSTLEQYIAFAAQLTTDFNRGHPDGSLDRNGLFKKWFEAGLSEDEILLIAINAQSGIKNILVCAGYADEDLEKHQALNHFTGSTVPGDAASRHMIEPYCDFSEPYSVVHLMTRIKKGVRPKDLFNHIPGWEEALADSNAAAVANFGTMKAVKAPRRNPQYPAGQRKPRYHNT